MSEQVKDKKQSQKLCKVQERIYNGMALEIRKTEDFLKKNITHISIISFISLLAFILEPKLTELLSALNIMFIYGLDQDILVLNHTKLYSIRNTDSIGSEDVYPLLLVYLSAVLTLIVCLLSMV